MIAVEEVYPVDVVAGVCSNMKVQIVGQPTGIYHNINFEPGLTNQIIDELILKSGTAYDFLKYPLVAMVMPVSERYGSGFLEVLFPRIIIAYLTKTNTRTEKVLFKYDSQGVFKTILRPCLREFIRQLAFSTYTSMGDPGVYQYTTRDIPCQQPLGEGISDFVDIIEIQNLNATLFSQIKTC